MEHHHHGHHDDHAQHEHQHHECCHHEGSPEDRRDVQAAARASAATEWTCPMHPEVVRDGPGDCPICGMALEPRTVTAEDAENPELTSMRRRFWVSAALSLPVLGAGGEGDD